MTHTVIFYLENRVHSVQTTQISYDWCVDKAVYEIDGKMYNATVNELQKGENNVKTCELKPVEYITL